MARIQIFGVHRTWEDCVIMLLGVVIALSPWPAQESYLGCPSVTAVVWNTMLVGILVSLLGAVEFVTLHRWEQIAEIACGAWLIASPFVFGYTSGGFLQHWHYGLGAGVLLLSMIELWQD